MSIEIAGGAPSSIYAGCYFDQFVLVISDQQITRKAAASCHETDFLETDAMKCAMAVCSGALHANGSNWCNQCASPSWPKHAASAQAILQVGCSR